MEDAIYRLSMELLAKIIGPFDVMGSVPSNRNTSKIRWIDGGRDLVGSNEGPELQWYTNKRSPPGYRIFRGTFRHKREAHGKVVHSYRLQPQSLVDRQNKARLNSRDSLRRRSRMVLRRDGRVEPEQPCPASSLALEAADCSQPLVRTP